MVETGTNREDIMALLNELQESYISCPNYTTVFKHIAESKEGKLGACGRAKILTNSLAFDTDPSTIKEILKNIGKGATYTYYMPKSQKIVNEIARYLGECMNVMPDIEKNHNEQEKIYERIKFSLFDSQIYCSYNFALFEQNASAKNSFVTFKQGWWYINPGSNPNQVQSDGSSMMIANEIRSSFELRNLEQCFDLLENENSTKIITGQEGIANLNNLGSYVLKED